MAETGSLAARLRYLALARDGRWLRIAAVAVGLAALTAYVVPGLLVSAAHWPMWDVQVYWWGGQQAARGGTLYAHDSPFLFTYPPFAALVFATTAGASIGFLKLAITAASVVALAVLCGQSLGAAGLRRRPETVFALTGLAMLTWPVAYTLYLGEINLILAALIGADLLRRRDGGWSQGIGVGLAAGIKLTPLIFVAYLVLTRRYRAAVTAIATFAATVAAGFAVLPSQSTTFWLDGVFFDQTRVGNTANPSDQSLAGAVARLAGSTAAATAASRPWWVVAVLITSVTGITIAAWAHRRGHRLAGVACCALTGLLISPISWTHHWVWAVPLLVTLTVAAWQRRSFGLGLVAVAVTVVFCGHIPMLWPGHPPSTERLVTGDLYVLCALAVLAGTALALTLERFGRGRPAEPHPPANTMHRLTGR
ncbi:MAG: glycosyltransferase 87 family protein [Actinomycetota bacterium]|nr:glycosyltransferase 87 family protein [Actinomycetota bacterium]